LHLFVFCTSSFFLGTQLILFIADVVSFMWLGTAAYTEYIGQGNPNPAYIPYLSRAFQLVGIHETETDATVKHPNAYGTKSWRGLRGSIGSNVRATIPLTSLTLY
jgi:hypothetical protein